MGKAGKAEQATTFKSMNPTIDLIMRCVQHHVLMGQAHRAKDPEKKKALEEQARARRGDIGPVAYDDALKFVARNGPIAQQAHGWARVAIAQLGIKGSFKFGDITIEVV